MRLLFDMNLTPQWVDAVSGSGHDGTHWSKIGRRDASDNEIFHYAQLHDFVIVTNDLDFPALLAHTEEQKPSVILLRGQPLIPDLRVASLLLAIESCALELQAGAILTLDLSGKPRVRILPLPK